MTERPSDSTFGFATTGAMAKEFVMRSRPSRKGMVIFAAAMAVIVVVAVALFTRGGKHGSGNAPLADQALGLNESAAARPTPATAAMPASAPASASGVARVDVAVTLPKFATDALAELKASNEGLTRRGETMDQRLAQVELDVGDMKRQAEEAKSAREAAEAAAKQASRRKAKERAAAPVVPPPPAAELLSVDTWDGRPSVSVKDGERLRFVGEGDTVGKSVVTRADRKAQRIELSTVGDANAAPSVESR